MESKMLAFEKKDDVTADEIAKLQTDLSNIPQSNFRRIAVDDVTPESLVRLLEENGTLLMISDEAGMLGNFSGRYSNNVPNIDLLLKCWNGETFISDRATRASIVLKKPYMSVCLACQPYVFDSMINNTAFRGSGLVARFLYCFPKSNIGTRKYDTQAVPEAVIENYKNLIYKLLQDKFTFHGDAKYYTHTTQTQYDIHTLHSSNLYQIFTYVKNKDTEFGDKPHKVSGMLLYAATDEVIQPDNIYHMSGNRISVRTLDLNKDFTEISDQLNAIVKEHFLKTNLD